MRAFSVRPKHFRTEGFGGFEKKYGAKSPVFTHYLAEKAGFEPAEGFTPRTLSRRVT